MTVIEEGARMMLRTLEDDAKSEGSVFYSVSSDDDPEPCDLMVFSAGRTWFGRVKLGYKRKIQEDDWEVIDRHQAVQLIENEISKIARKKGGTTA